MSGKEDGEKKISLHSLVFFKSLEMRRGLLMTWKWWAEASENHLACFIASLSHGDVRKNPGAAGHLRCSCLMASKKSTARVCRRNQTLHVPEFGKHM